MDIEDWILAKLHSVFPVVILSLPQKTMRQSDEADSPPSTRSRSQEPSARNHGQDTVEDVADATGDSERVASSNDSSHRRSMSDPFVANEDTVGKVLKHDVTKNGTLPTFPRFPVIETKNLNCWSEPNVDIFRVRGQGYLEDKKKVTSGPYLLQARGCDLFLTENAPLNIGG